MVPPSPTKPAELLGRGAETTLIQAVLSERTGVPKSVLFTGEPGVGKSSLLEFAAHRARSDGVLCVTVWGSESESDIPFAGLNQAVIALESQVSELDKDQAEALRVVRGDVGAPTNRDRLAVFSAAARLFAAAGKASGLLICLDDVQFLDQASADALLFLARRLDGMRVTIIATTVTSPPWLRDVAEFRVHEVAPLSADLSRLLLRQRFPKLDDRVRDRLIRDAEGVPLALLELPPALVQSDADLRSLPTNLPLSRRLQATFEGRIRSLPPATRALLLAAALEGTGELEVLRRVSGDPGLTAARAAEEAGLVRLSAEQSRLSFRHPLTRAAVAGQATAEELREAHRELASALHYDEDRMARHLAAAVLEPDEAIAQVLLAAGRRAVERDIDGVNVAMKLIVRAADLSPSVEDRRERMAEAAFVGALRYSAPEPGLLRRAGDARPGSDEALWAAAASAFAGCHRLSDLNSICRMLNSALEAALDEGNTSSDAYGAALEAHFLVCSFSDASAHLSKFEMWLGASTNESFAQQLTALTAMLDPARSAAELIPMVDLAINRAETTSDMRVIGFAAGGAVYLDRLYRCRAALDRVAALGPSGAVGGDLPVRVQLSTEAFQSGRWDEVSHLAIGGAELSASRASLLGSAIFRQRRILISAVRGDSREVMALADSLLTEIVGRGYLHIEHEVQFALALDAAGRQHYEATFHCVTKISEPGSFPRGAPVALWVFFELVNSAVRIGRVDDAAAHLAEARRLNLAAISPRYALMVCASEAMLLDRGQNSAALLADPLEHPDLEHWPFDLARMRLLQAEFLIDGGHPNKALIHIDEATVILRTISAAPWISIAERLRDRIASASGISPRMGLTATELKVVRLAAKGMTNKEIGDELFLSPRTVATHLYWAFPKLGITRRAALRDAIAEMDRLFPAP